MNRNAMIITGSVLFVFLVIIGFGRMRNGGDTPKAEPVKTAAAQELFDQAKALKAERDLVDARALLRKIMSDHTDFEDIELVQKELEEVNMEIIFSNIPTEDTVMHEVVSGDTLGKLASKYGTTVALIKRNNSLKSNLIRVGQKLRIWTAKFNVFVDKSQNILILKQGDEVIKVYDVSTGQNNSTPVGDFKVNTKLIDPVWFKQGLAVPPESPQNELGSRWLGFDTKPRYGIHGTIEPKTIGQQSTAGCVRMRNEDVEELYDLLPRGTKVTVVD